MIGIVASVVSVLLALEAWTIAVLVVLLVAFVYVVYQPYRWHRLFTASGASKILRESRTTLSFPNATRHVGAAAIERLTENTGRWFNPGSLTFPNDLMAREAYLALLQYWSGYDRFTRGMLKDFQFLAVHFSSHHVWLSTFGSAVQDEQAELEPAPLRTILVGELQPKEIAGTTLYEVMQRMIQVGVIIYYLPRTATAATPRDFLLLTEKKQLVEWNLSSNGHSIQSGRFLDHATATDEDKSYIDDTDFYYRKRIAEYCAFYSVPEGIQHALDSVASLRHFCDSGEPRCKGLLAQSRTIQ